MDISTSQKSNEIYIETKSEFMTAKVLSPSHAITLSATYHLYRSNQTNMDNVNQAIPSLCHMLSNILIWIGGDINLQDIDWESE